jgi:hypothetical protein
VGLYVHDIIYLTKNRIENVSVLVVVSVPAKNNSMSTFVSCS